MAADLEIRSATAADTDRIIELVEMSLGTGRIPRSREYWEWKHHRSPFGASPMMVAEAEGELVGLRVFMPWEWRAGERTVRAVRAVDTATHPRWRGRGLFTRLTLALAERLGDQGVELVFNTPNEQSRPGYLKMGWSSLGRASLLIHPWRPMRLLPAALERRGCRGGTRAGLPDPGEPVRALLDRPELIALLERVDATRDGRLTTPRGPEYLRWRYADVPGFAYRAGWAFDGRDGAALVWRLVERWGLCELRLCEVLLTPGPGGRRLAREALRRLPDTCGADYVSAMAPAGTAEWRALVRSGFLPVPRVGPSVTVRPLAPLGRGPDPLLRRSWRWSIGDLELF